MQKKVLVIIVLAQLACTSLWFAPNGISEDIASEFGVGTGLITSSVQLGFIFGTLLFAFFQISDRFSPSRIFLISSCCGALVNAAIPEVQGGEWVLTLRFLTGFSLAGIYPVGMKIAADYHERGLGVALGFLVGALVIGTALPHLTSGLVGQSWKNVLLVSSGLAVTGGLAVGVLVPDGPYRKQGDKFNPALFFTLFRMKKFRSAALGYFGHMWELYAFWAFIPAYLGLYPGFQKAIPEFTFATISAGGVGCIVGGFVARKWGSGKVAAWALGISLICCICSPVALSFDPDLFYLFMMIWGAAVVTDSPQFSTLVAASAPPKLVGTGLTIVNAIGFAITIGSISLLGALDFNEYSLLWLGIGPVLGLVFFLRN